LTLKTGRADDLIYLTVTDTGTGIPPEVLERLFDPFFTTKPDGTGLGLAVSRKILDDHGGRIEVQSQVNKGTTFRVMLPTTAPVISANITQAAQISGLNDRIPMPAPLPAAGLIPAPTPKK
jgi:two-component system NtrC family sensor kinase